MPLTKTEIELLEGIRGNLKRGDINKIAEKTKFTREHVTKVLSLNTDDFNKDIIAAAVKLISDREEAVKKMLRKLPECNNNTLDPIMQ